MFVVSYAETPWSVVPGTDTLYKLMNDVEVGDREEFEMSIRRREAPQAVHRHRHKIDQIRYTLPGPDAAWSPDQATPSGSMLYVGAGILYGPYERAAGEEYFTIKFGGSENKPEDKSRPFPKARFSSPIEFNPANFSWSDRERGVREKELASFTERKSRFSMLAVDQGAGTTLKNGQTTLCLVTSGSGTMNGAALGQWDAITLSANEATEVAGGESGIELLVIEMPLPLRAHQGLSNSSAA